MLPGIALSMKFCLVGISFFVPLSVLGQGSQVQQWFTIWTLCALRHTLPGMLPRMPATIGARCDIRFKAT